MLPLFLVLVSAGGVIELAFAPFLFTAFPHDIFFAYLLERCQYATFDGRTSVAGNSREATTELLINQVIRIVLRKFALLLDD